jgi:hypothetical protein
MRETSGNEKIATDSDARKNNLAEGKEPILKFGNTGL